MVSWGSVNIVKERLRIRYRDEIKEEKEKKRRREEKRREKKRKEEK
jgi:hypothetical protein